MVKKKKRKSTNTLVVYKELMKYKSFRESTPRTRETSMPMTISRRYSTARIRSRCSR